MATIDVYTKIHKGQRAWLSELLVRAGRLGEDDSEGSALLRRDMARLSAHLRDHAEHEDRFVHPLLYEAAPAVARSLEQQHRTLDVALARIADPGLDPGSRYRVLAALCVEYFEHLAAEELAALPALQQRFTDDEIVARILRPFAGSRTRETLLADLALQLAAVTPAEGRSLLAALA